jgi:seryl-tRNA synthetase
MTRAIKSWRKIVRHNFNKITLVDLFRPPTQQTAHEEQVEYADKMLLK